jgi:hypothetical protein
MERRATVGLKTVRVEELSFPQVRRLTNFPIGSKGRTLEVIPPGNEGISDDVVENKGRFQTSAGISNDVIENTPLVRRNPTILMKIKEMGKASSAENDRSRRGRIRLASHFALHIQEAIYPCASRNQNRERTGFVECLIFWVAVNQR